ncbi:hypothetical protein ABTM07_20730, partial [Acinetobacter baumannii]
TGRRGLLALAVGGGLVYAGAYQFVLPGLDRIWLSNRLVERLATVRPCATGPLAAVGYSEPSLVFLAGTDIHLTNAAD